jgi:enoyl-CoA hydratase/carnithine racemase
MILTGEPLATEAAARWGLVDQVAPPEDLDDAVNAVVADALEGGADRLRARRLEILTTHNAAAAASLRTGQ